MKKVYLLLLLLLIPFLCGAAQVYLSDVQAAILERDYTKSEKLARKFISQNPPKRESDEAQYFLGLSLLRRGQTDQAKEVFHLLIRYKPSQFLSDKAYLGMMDCHYMDEHYDEALELGQALLRRSPNSEFHSLIYLKLARANLKLAKWGKARSYLNKIGAQFPHSLEAPIARQLLDEKQYFAVQVGSFLERHRAESLLVGLKNQGEYAYIVETQDKAGRKFYRVRVGQLSRLNEAKQLKQKLAQSGYPTRIYP